MVIFVFHRYGIDASGHAMFAEEGQDIVCAALSAVFLSGIMCFKKKDVLIQKDRQGRTVFSLKKEARNEQNLIVLNTLKKQIRIVVNFYPQYAKIVRK